MAAAEADDSLLRAYWEIMDRLHRNGHEIDANRLNELERSRVYAVIPSPARAAKPRDWVLDPVSRH